MLITIVARGALSERYVAGAQRSIYINPWPYTCTLRAPAAPWKLLVSTSGLYVARALASARCHLWGCPGDDQSPHRLLEALTYHSQPPPNLFSPAFLKLSDLVVMAIELMDHFFCIDSTEKHPTGGSVILPVCLSYPRPRVAADLPRKDTFSEATFFLVVAPVSRCSHNKCRWRWPRAENRPLSVQRGQSPP